MADNNPINNSDSDDSDLELELGYESGSSDNFDDEDIHATNEENNDDEHEEIEENAPRNVAGAQFGMYEPLADRNNLADRNEQQNDLIANPRRIDKSINGNPF